MSIGVIWLATFLFSLVAGLALQMLVLPAIPSFHAGLGIIINTDGVLFHEIATRMASAIREDGWSAWSLRPELQAPAGLSAIAYVLTGVERPVVLLPLGAALFATGAAGLLFAMRACGPPGAATLAVLPFVLFPTAVQIYGQVHKDAWSIAGYLALLAAWIMLAARTPWSWWRATLVVALAVGGCLMIWIVRPQVMQIAIAATAGSLIVILLQSARRRAHSWWLVVALCAVTPVVVRFVLPIGPGEVSVTWQAETSQAEISQGEISKAEPLLPIIAESLAKEATSFSFGPLDRLALRLSATRELFATHFPKAGSNIDTEVRFASFHDLLAYLPRAMQIGFLAPFPYSWFDEGTGPASRIMRLVAAGEMTLAYALLVGLPLLFFFGPRDRVPIFIVFVFAMAMVLVYALAVPNVGTMYRMRYAGWQLANGLGVMGWAALLARR